MINYIFTYHSVFVNKNYDLKFRFSPLHNFQEIRIYYTGGELICHTTIVPADLLAELWHLL